MFFDNTMFDWTFYFLAGSGALVLVINSVCLVLDLALRAYRKIKKL